MPTTSLHSIQFSVFCCRLKPLIPPDILSVPVVYHPPITPHAQPIGCCCVQMVTTGMATDYTAAFLSLSSALSQPITMIPTNQPATHRVDIALARRKVVCVCTET